MAGKITVVFQNGRRRVLKTPEEFYKIDKNRKAMFVMNNLRNCLKLELKKCYRA
ncbi:hypothetical protein [Duncaniella freteri]|uniref:hypothetical protein n=1 Tax=Duncaniella freteri TaxID=2530391 RepID=UPI0014833BE7|nr:hypothetical protein [Duncaniella freteri]